MTLTRRPALVTVVALLMVSIAAGCGPSGSADPADRSAKAGTRSTTTTTTAGAAAPTTDAAAATSAPAGCTDVAPSGQYAVGRQQVSLVDPSRPTGADPGRGIPAATSRTLPVAVLYPAAGEPGAAGTLTDGAEPLDGPFPVVIYSHGVDSNGTERNDTLATWARAGYVVVAPTYPLSSQKGGQVGDVVNQPSDVMFVNAQLSEPASPLALLASHMAVDCLALAGHSLGALTTVGTTFDPCCRPAGQKAAIMIVGGLFLPTAGTDPATVPKVPSLLVHGQKDARVPYDNSLTLRSTLPGRTWLLRFPEGQHSAMFDPPLNQVLDTVVVGFLDAELRGDSRGLDHVATDLAGRPDAAFEAPAGG